METTHEALLVTLAVENDERRTGMIALLDDMKLQYSLVDISVLITDIDKEILARSSVIILDTNDDAASLVHIVHEIYKLFPTAGGIPIFGVLSSAHRPTK